MSELWSGDQHRWLEALGHQVYVQGGLPAEPAQSPSEAPAASGERGPASRQAPARGAGTRAAAPPAAPARRAPLAEAGGLAPDRLHIALIRASGCNPNAPGAEQLMAGWPSASQLRGDAAAKRALWPRLRALRRSASP